MKKLYTLLALFTFIFSGQSQEFRTNFVDAIKTHIKKYNIQSDIAYAQKDTQKAQVLFDSLVSNHLVGTTFEDYKLKSFAKKNVRLSKFNKPLFILTYSSWCIPSKGEIPALNKLAQKYGNEVKFVILFWDKKYNVKKIARKFNHNITVCYAHESYKNDASMVANVKHTLGFPTSYFLDQNLKVVAIKRGGAHPDSKISYEKSLTLNYNNFKEGLSNLLIDKNISEGHITSN